MTVVLHVVEDVGHAGEGGLRGDDVQINVGEVPQCHVSGCIWLAWRMPHPGLRHQFDAGWAIAFGDIGRVMPGHV
jgi:hypothetical protein